MHLSTSLGHLSGVSVILNWPGGAELRSFQSQLVGNGREASIAARSLRGGHLYDRVEAPEAFERGNRYMIAGMCAPSLQDTDYGGAGVTETCLLQY